MARCARFARPLSAGQINQPLPIVIVAGTTTGCVDGVLCNDVPLLFRSELYASVSVVTGALYVTGLRMGNAEAAFGIAFRLLAIRNRCEMPKFVCSRDWN